MRCLIVRKTWLDLIFEGLKGWEMRATGANVRGPIGLIEAGSGLVVGTADLTNVLYPLPADQRARFFPQHRVDDLELLEKWCIPWVLEKARRFETPVSYVHPQGAVIWVNVPDEVFEAANLGGGSAVAEENATNQPRLD